MGGGDGSTDPTTSTEGLGGLFEDLEQQAAGMHLAERDAELVDRARGEYAAVTLASRFHASVGRHVALTLTGGEVLDGMLAEAGVDWCTLSSPERPDLWLVRLAAVASARGLSVRAVPEEARPVVARLGFGSALHRVAGESAYVLLRPVTGRDVRVQVIRIGADFVEAEPEVGEAPPSPSPVLVPFAAIRAVRGRPGR